jgi:signal transduction histidine kinase
MAAWRLLLHRPFGATTVSTTRQIFPSSYEARLAVATTALVALVCAGLSWRLASGALGDLRAHIVQRGRSVVAVIARDAEVALQRGDLTAVAAVAERARLEGDVLAEHVFDPRGLLLVATGTTAGGGMWSTSPADGVPADPVVVDASAWELWSTIPLSPVAGASPLGTVSVRISTMPLAELRDRVVVTASALTVLFMAIGALGALAVARAMTRPLAGLARAAEAFASGDLAIRVPIDRADELGTLAHSFNVMAASLASTHAALEDKVRELEAANHLKSEFLSTVSHELRTPLNVIMGNLEMAEEQAAQRAPELLPLLATIRRYASLQLDLVTSVLDFERLSSGATSFRVETFDLRPLIEDVLALLTTHVRPGVVLQAVLDPDCPPLATDRIKVHQILRNLVDNAVKFTESGRVTVEVGPGTTPGRTRIVVTDTGPGIPSEELARIFDPFHQLGPSSTRQTSGVGLGLSIVKQLVTALGGDMSVSSEVGWGSTFRVELPSMLRGTPPTRAPGVHPPSSVPRQAA